MHIVQQLNKVIPPKKGFNLTYDTDYNLVNNTLRNMNWLMFPKTMFNSKSNDAANVINRGIIINRILLENRSLGAIINGITFSGIIKKGKADPLEVLYHGIDQDFSIPILIA